MERQAPTYGKIMRSAEKWFGVAAYPLVFFAPNNFICLFAGAAGMSIPTFLVLNVSGTIVRLYVIRVVGDIFAKPIDSVLRFIQDYRLPLIIASVVLVGITIWSERRQGGELESLTHLDDELGHRRRRGERSPDETRGVAVVTGASSGIGAATAASLASEGFDVVLGARRIDRLREVAASIGDAARALPLDVTDPASVDAFCAEITECRLLVNNAGGALGRDAVAEADEAQWQWMYDANVLGVMRMTKALLPKLIASGDGHVITIGSIAGIEPYPGGAGYNAAKHAVRAVMDVLRMELLGQPVRVSEIDPGMVETEFSIVRFGGDEQTGRQGVRGHDAAHRRRHRRLHRVGRDASEPRRHRPDGRPPARPSPSDHGLQV